MLKGEPIRLRKERNGEPCVVQYEVPGQFRLSFNPDDNRFYVETWASDWSGWETAATFAEWRNAVYYAKNKTIPAAAAHLT